jgi:diguanylate cyclase (GGDEF)-like protein
MDRAQRLSSRALTTALLCGSVFGVTGASGHGDTAMTPHFARPVAVRMSAHAHVPTVASDQAVTAGSQPSGDGQGTTPTTSTTPTPPDTTSTSTTPDTTTSTTTTPGTTTTTTSSTPDTTTTSTTPGTTSTETTPTSTGPSQGEGTSDTTSTGSSATCPPAPGTPGFVSAGHATGDPWKNCTTRTGPAGSGQAGGGTTPPPVTVPTTPVTVTTTPTTPTTPTTTPVTVPVTTPSDPSTKGHHGSGFQTGKSWTTVTASGPGTSKTADALLGTPNGLAPALFGTSGTAAAVNQRLASATGSVGVAGTSGSGAAGAQGTSSANAGGRTTGHGHVGGGSSSHSSFLPPILIPQFIRVIPESVWLALIGSLGLAAMGTGAAIYFGRRSRRQADQIAEVSAAALTDPLTGVLNRRGFTEAVERELARSRRYARPFVIAYVDVRGLKRINDSEGHLAGDELLKAAASTLAGSARAHDVVGRLGGDEFGILLAEQSADDAEIVTSRIHERVAATREQLGFKSHWDLTVGIAAFDEDGESFEELIAAADRRLYEQRGIELSASR